jgi:hypothetical protein
MPPKLGADAAAPPWCAFTPESVVGRVLHAALGNDMKFSGLLSSPPQLGLSERPHQQADAVQAT